MSLVAGVLAVTGACGDDDASTTTTTPPPTSGEVEPAEDADTEVAPELAELCELAGEVNEQDGPPTAAQLERYAELAPDELRPAVETVAAAFIAAGDDVAAVFADPEATAALEQITEFEASSCQLGSTRDASVNEIDPDATRVDVTATDFHFDADFPTSAGRYSFVINNDGAEPHLAILARLEDGVTVEQALQAEGEEGVAESFESEVAPPGEQTVVSAELTPGNWVLICPIPDAEGTPHVAMGMVHDFTIA